MKNILVGIDGSQASMNALKYAVKMARTLRANVLGINVINDMPYSEYYKDISPKLKKEAEDMLKRAVTSAFEEGVTIRAQVDYGDPDDVLAERARTDPDVAMIVTAASRRSRIANLFIRSKAHALVDQVAAGLQCPLIVVPERDENFLNRI